MKLMLVDDNQEMRRLIRSTVAGPDDVVYEASDGADAFALYARCHPDWVLMDFKMSKLDGVVATKQIKEAFPEARIVVVSQYDDTEIREAARQAGAGEYVLKDDLLALRGILSRRITSSESPGELRDPQRGGDG